jgi:hypothetical protein
MPAIPETLLATLPGTDDRQQLLVVLVMGENGGTHVELRQQSWGEGLGWYNQGTVRLEPAQVAGLRQSLGLGGSFSQVRTTAFPAAAPAKARGFVPRVVHADVG